MNHMANNVPMDYQGYSDSSTADFDTKTSTAMSTVLQNVPCFDPEKDGTISSSNSKATECYNTVMRLAYLNQQLDQGSLTLRANKDCLTQTELDAYSNQDIAENHPLNCAKMNAKPFPYFDGGMMFVRKDGWFPFYSSRNNNFSNRQNIGIICVGSTCKLQNGTGVLQDQNPEVNGRSITNNAASKCEDTLNQDTSANANGARSCLSTASGDSVTLSGETYTIQQGDNDAKGDGNKKSCTILTFFDKSNSSVEQKVVLAIILLFVGLFASWLAYYLYNRYFINLICERHFSSHNV
jgi:hypothetical protein